MYTGNKSKLKVMKTQMPAMSNCTDVGEGVLGTILYVQVMIASRV
jgi:hypothetical protein